MENIWNSNVKFGSGFGRGAFRASGGWVELVFIIPLLTLYGFAISLLWGWLIIPIFPSLPQISIAQGVGMMTFIKFFRKFGAGELEEKSTAEQMMKVAETAMKPVFFMAVGYIVQLFY